LSGGFLVDDFINLDALGSSGAIDNWPAFWRYITSGTADPVGRPLALLSFLIDARDWPADPASFLRTNLLLHLLNGTLLFSLLRQLGRALNTADTRNEAAALLAAGMWLVHPLFVSTTLYAVQREAILPTTFVLLGLLAYAHGRMRFASTEGSSGTAWLVSGICLGTLLAVLSKANGLLLPLLAGVVEVTVFRQGTYLLATSHANKRLRRLLWLLLVLPSMLIFAYVAHFGILLNADVGRPWTIAQRLLTEPRILLDYLNLLVVPRSVSTGLYNDSYMVSLGLWQPLSTVPALLLVSGLGILGFRIRRIAPSLSAALLFFLAGHLLESTIIPLELYFEHRNYLPALLLFWPVARGICAWKIAKPMRVAIAAGTLALLVVTTHQRAQLWGQPERLASLWLYKNPESSRALSTVAIQLVNSGKPQQALELLGPKWRQRPDDLQIAVNYANAACAWRGLQDNEVQALGRALRLSHDRQEVAFQWLNDAIKMAGDGNCVGLNLDNVEWLVLELQKNATYRDNSREQNLHSLLAQIALWRRQPDRALDHFDSALLANVGPDVALRQAALLGSNGYYQQALAHLNTYERVKNRAAATGPGMPWLHAKVMEWQNYWPLEIALLQQRLRTEILAQPNAGR
jgi:tetratricopeptide (TPR) repeat protein